MKTLLVLTVIIAIMALVVGAKDGDDGSELDALRGKPKFHVKRVRTRWVVRKKKPKAK